MRYWYAHRSNHGSRWSRMSQPKKIGFLGLVAFLIALTGWLCYGYFGVVHQSGKIIQCRWAYHIDVERWDRKHYDRSSSSHPSSCKNRNFCGGTYNSHSWAEYDSSSETSSTYYEYDHDEWVTHRTFSRTGTDKNPQQDAENV